MGHLLLFFWCSLGPSWFCLTNFGRMEGVFCRQKRKDVWRAGPLCLFWTIWKARNKIAFDGATLSI